jgi:predicted ABC-type exoprotein transport system permease subunit
MEYLKAVLLGPVAFAGIMFPMWIAFPARTLAEFFFNLVVLAAFHIIPVLMLVIACRRENATTLGHSGCVWIWLIGIAYGIGFGLGVIAFLLT